MIIETNTRLKEAGLTPFDLLLWEVLLRLRYDFVSRDIIHTHYITEELDNALRRKATMLDSNENTNLYSKTLEAWSKSG